MMNKLSRELLKWIQSLDLAYSVKNVKRDFANGFLVAEVLSRYFDKEISMHSFDNGIAKKAKEDNWNQLLKFFDKHPALADLVAQDQVDAIIHCENGAAVAFLNRLYELLTCREIQHVHPKPEQDIPPYAKPTGSSLIRDKMNSAEILTSSDERHVMEQLKAVNEAHEESLFLERSSVQPNSGSSGFSPVRTTTLMVKKGSTSVVNNNRSSTGASLAVVPVKQVQVKSLNAENLAQLRQRRDATPCTGLDSPPRYAEIEIDPLKQHKNPLALLDEYLRRTCPPELVQTWEELNVPLFQACVDYLCEGLVFSERERVELMDGLESETRVLSATLLAFPKEFHHITGMLFQLLQDQPEHMSLFTSTIGVFTSLGKACVAQVRDMTCMNKEEEVTCPVLNHF